MFSDEVHTELDLPYQLHRLASVQSNHDLNSNSLSTHALSRNSLSNRVSLAAVSPQAPFNNPDILQIALQEKAAHWRLASQIPALRPSVFASACIA